MELAKMTGMTPPEFTLSGRWLDWPPIMRRPTMRRALWMGMRRSQRSTKTMKATTATMPTSQQQHREEGERAPGVGLDLLISSPTPRGRPATMPAKISRLMPLPMPRSVICSPSHMMKAVPVVSVRMVIRLKPMPGCSTRPCCGENRGNADRLQRGQDHGHVAGPLRDLASSQFAFLLDARQGLIDHRQQLEDDRRRDVRHNAQREDGHAAQVAAAEQIHQAQGGTALHVEHLFELRAVDARRGDVRAQPVNGQDAEREQNPLAQVGNPEDIEKLLKHNWVSASGVAAGKKSGSSPS